MKKIIYIISFTFFGLLFGLFLVEIFDLVYFNLYSKDLISLGLIGGLIVIFFGILGLFSGRYFWHQIYELKIWRKWIT